MNEKIYLKLTQINGIGKKTILFFREYLVNSKCRIKELDNKDIIYIFEEIKKQNKRLKVPSLNEVKEAEENALKIIRDCKKSNIQIVTIDNTEYPYEFKVIKTPPVVYFAKGNHNALNKKKKIAIIGTRYPTERGKKCAYKIAEYFTKRKFVIVSGLANGCDTYGHLGCVENKGSTVATLPSGLDKIYPSINKELAQKIIQNNGCLITEYPLGIEASEYRFIQRDRLQAALSKVVIVIETRLRGGTMHTVKFAKQYNKQLASLSLPKENYEFKRLEGNKKILDEENTVELSSVSDLEKIEDYYFDI